MSYKAREVAAARKPGELTIDEAAEQFGINRNTLAARIMRGKKIPFRRVGSVKKGSILVLEADVAAHCCPHCKAVNWR